MPDPERLPLYNTEGLRNDPQTTPDFFTRSIAGGEFISGGNVSIRMGIKGDTVLSSIERNGTRILQPDTGDCGWTPTQLLSLKDKVAKISTYKIQSEQCIDELENTRLKYILAPGAKNFDLPSDLKQASITLLSLDMQNEIEELFVAGDKSKGDVIDGLVTLLTSEATTTKLQGEALSKDNILSELERIYLNGFTDDVLNSTNERDLRILVSPQARRLIRAALAEKSNQVIANMITIENQNKTDYDLYYNGIKIITAQGMPRDTIVAYSINNVLLLTDLQGDLEYIRVGNFPAPKDNIVYFDGRLRIGCDVFFPDECVLRILNA